MVAPETRGRIAAQQAAGSLPWIGVDDPSELQRLQADHAARMQESANFQLGRPEKRTGAHDPRHVLQRNGGPADSCCMDDGDILCHPILVPSYLQTFDVANAKVGGERNPQKTEVIHYVNDLGAASLEWRIRDVQNMAKVSTVTAGITPGVAVGPHIADQFLAKADVIRAVHERVQLCQDPQTGLLLRQSLGASRINHILRVQGHIILQEQRAAEIYDEVGQRSLERLFPGLTEDSMTQATLSAGQSGIGHKRVRDT